MKSLEIYNDLGQTILNKSIDADKININTENYGQEIYFLKIVTDAGVINKKFSVVKR